jgi:hypothetical protein
MARANLEDFAGKEVARVYIAARVSEAERVENILEERGIDYAVEIEPFRKNLLGFLPTEYTGVAFYVVSGQAAFTRQLLLAAGLSQGIAADEASS